MADEISGTEVVTGAPGEATGAAPAESSTQPQAEQPAVSEQPSRLWDRFFGSKDTRRTARTTSADATSEPAGAKPAEGETPAAEAATGDSAAAAKPAAADPAQSGQKPAEGDDDELTLTRGELRRLVQSEKDRELHAERVRTQSQQIADLERQKAEAKQSGDSMTAMELDDQIEAIKKGVIQEHQAVNSQADAVTFYEEQFIDPLLDELPEDVREGILAKPWVGMKGRVELAAATREALKKHHIAEGRRLERDRMEKDPTIQKQLYQQFRGTEAEPELVAAAPSTRNGGGQDMNSFIRRSVGRE